MPKRFRFSGGLVFLRGEIEEGSCSEGKKTQEASGTKDWALRGPVLKNCSSSAVNSRKLIKDFETFRDAGTKSLEESVIVGTILNKRGRRGQCCARVLRRPWCSEEHALPRRLDIRLSDNKIVRFGCKLSARSDVSLDCS